jgi:hypothetical protein
VPDDYTAALAELHGQLFPARTPTTDDTQPRLVVAHEGGNPAAPLTDRMRALDFARRLFDANYRAREPVSLADLD